MGTTTRSNLRSHDVQELLGKTPSWVVQYGSLFLGLAVLAMFLVGWLLKYPQIVQAPINISTNVPPVPVVARAEGYLAEVFVEEGQLLQEGTPIAILSNSGLYQDIKTLEQKLDAFSPFNSNTYEAFSNTESLVLGDLQLDFTEFIKALKLYQGNGNEDLKHLDILQVKNDLNNAEERFQNELNRLDNAEKNLATKERTLQEAQDLYSEGKITMEKMVPLSADRTSAQDRVRDIKLGINSLKLEIKAHKNRLNLLEKSSQVNTSEAIDQIDENYKRLKSALAIWKKKYLIVSPAKGKINFFKAESGQQVFLRKEEEFAVVVPDAKGALIGRASLPIAHKGKVEEGQKVLIRLASYPFQEYGKINGIVSFKAKVPKDGAVALEISLPNKLLTSKGQTIAFEQQLVGTAEIITEEKRFFQRIFDGYL